METKINLRRLTACVISVILIISLMTNVYADDMFQVNKEELEFLYDFCSEQVVDDQYYSEEFSAEYQSVLDKTNEAILNFEQLSQEQAEEAYWELFFEYNKACAYNDLPGDINVDGITDINDCSLMQQAVANFITLNYSQLYQFGFDIQGQMTIMEVTNLQKALAGYGALSFSEDYINLQNNLKTKNIEVNKFFYEAYSQREPEAPQTNGIKVFVSPSNQYKNIYSAGDTNEMEQCNKIAQVVERCLLEHGFLVMRAPEGQNMYDTIDQSNEWGADLHIPIHTNAFNYQVTGGTMVMVYDISDTENAKAARAILDSLSPITPGPDYSLQVRKDLHELSDIEAMSVYVECEFHDTVEGATFIINNIEPIGEAIAKGVCDYYGVEW